MIKIFEVEIDYNKVKEGIYALEYVREKELMLEKYKKMNYKVASIIDDYHSGYQALVDEIINNKNDMPKIKACIREIIKSYSSLFKLDYIGLFYKLGNNAPMAIFVMLMNEEMRYMYLANEEDFDEKNNSIMDSDKKDIIDHLSKISLNCTFFDTPIKEILGEYLCAFADTTNEYWKDLEIKGRFMILKMENSNFIRNQGKGGEELSAQDINGNFVILNGIDYKSNNSSHELLNQRQTIIKILNCLASLGMNKNMPHWEQDANAARLLAGAVWQGDALFAIILSKVKQVNR